MSELAGIDILSFTVAALGLLTTVLIGWQIYQVVFIDRIVNDKVKDTESKIKKETAIWNLKSLSYAVSNSYYTGCYDNAVILLSFIPEHIEYGSLQNDAKVINEQILNINKVLDIIENEKFKLDDESCQRFSRAFSGYELFCPVLQRLKNIQQESAP